MRRPAAIPLAAAVALLVTACGSGTSARPHSASASVSAATSTARANPPVTSPAAVASGHATVSISMFAFKPATLVVAPGTRITFTNHDMTAHTATTVKRGFDTGTVNPGQSVTVTLSAPGTYTYYCEFHAFMRGTVVVRG